MSQPKVEYFLRFRTLQGEPKQVMVWFLEQTGKTVQYRLVGMLPPDPAEALATWWEGQGLRVEREQAPYRGPAADLFGPAP